MQSEPLIVSDIMEYWDSQEIPRCWDCGTWGEAQTVQGEYIECTGAVENDEYCGNVLVKRGDPHS